MKTVMKFIPSSEKRAAIGHDDILDGMLTHYGIGIIKKPLLVCLLIL